MTSDCSVQSQVSLEYLTHKLHSCHSQWCWKSNPGAQQQHKNLMN